MISHSTKKIRFNNYEHEKYFEALTAKTPNFGCFANLYCTNAVVIMFGKTKRGGDHETQPKEVKE